MSLGQGNEDTT